jgi:hypothetical protein
MENKELEAGAHIPESQTEMPTQETKAPGKKVKFNKPPQNKKPSGRDLALMECNKMIDMLCQDVITMAQHIEHLEQQIAMTKTRQFLALLELYDVQFAECPKIKEWDILKDDFKKYVPVLHYYHKDTDNKMVKIVPMEEGWKMKSMEPDNKEKPTRYKVSFEFNGVAPTTTYPTTYTIDLEDPSQAILKLREHLKSIKEGAGIIL